MDKVIIKCWEDLNEHCYIKDGDVYIFCPYQIEIRIDPLKTHLKYAVELLNKVFEDCNFEYQEAKVIDTYEKWEKFQKNISKEGLIYSRESKVFVTVKILSVGYITSCLHKTIKDIEEDFNVDLKILKEDK